MSFHHGKPEADWTDCVIVAISTFVIVMLMVAFLFGKKAAAKPESHYPSAVAIGPDLHMQRICEETGKKLTYWRISEGGKSRSSAFGNRNDDDVYTFTCE